MTKQHEYTVNVQWNGNRGTGTSGYKEYGREHTVSVAGKPAIAGSADPTFLGTPDRWNPEELLVVALSQCHMMSYLYVAAKAGVIVTAYVDDAIGVLETTPGGGGRFTRVTLRPRVMLADPAQRETAIRLHEDAQRECFIASSVNFPVIHEPHVE